MIVDIRPLLLGILMASTVSQDMPSSSQVTVYPKGIHVAYVHGEATFTCLSTKPGVNVVNITWLVRLENDTLLDYRNRDDIIAEFSPIGNGLGTLKFKNLLLVYNMSRIKCEAHYNSGTPIVRSVEATLLLVQDVLSAVSSFIATVQDSMFFLNWIAPHSLDLTDIDPDIEGYCIDIENSTSSSTIHSECNIIATEFTYPHPARGWCDTFVFVVTPVNAAGNGTQIAVPHYHRPAYVADVLRMPSSSDPFSIWYTLIMTAGVCTSHLTFTDLHTDDVISMGDIMGDVTISEKNITFSTERLKTNRLYSVTVTASNNRGPAISNISLGTHDIVTATATETYVNTVYSENSDASGALFSFVFITNSGDVDFDRSFLLALDRNTSHNYTLPFDLYPGHYRVFVYDIEHDGTLSDGVGYPAVTDNFTMSLDNQDSFFRQEPSYLLACQTNSISSVITVECMANGSQVVAGFQVIAQSSDASEVHKLYVNQSTDLQMPVSVSVESDGVYQVSIFAIREDIGIPEYLSAEPIIVSDALAIATEDASTGTQPEDSTGSLGSTTGSFRNTSHHTVTTGETSSIAGSTAAAVFLIIVVVVLLLCLYCWYRSHKTVHKKLNGIENGNEQHGGSDIRFPNNVQSKDSVTKPLLQPTHKSDAKKVLGTYKGNRLSANTTPTKLEEYEFVDHSLNDTTKKGDEVDVEPSRETSGQDMGQQPIAEPEVKQRPKVDPDMEHQPVPELDLKQQPKLEPTVKQQPKVDPDMEHQPVPELDLKQQPKLEPAVKQQPKLEPHVEQQPHLPVPSEPDVKQQPVTEVFETHKGQHFTSLVVASKAVAEDSNEDSAGKSELVMPRERTLSITGVPEGKPGAAQSTTADKDHVEQDLGKQSAEVRPKSSAETTHEEPEITEHNNFPETVEDTSEETNEKPFVAGIVVPTKQEEYKLVGHGLDDSTKKGEKVDIGAIHKSVEPSQETLTDHRYSMPMTHHTRDRDGESPQSQNAEEIEKGVAFHAQVGNLDESLQLQGEMVPEDEKGDEGVP